jgi:hypothetical protein
MVAGHSHLPSLAILYAALIAYYRLQKQLLGLPNVVGTILFCSSPRILAVEMCYVALQWVHVYVFTHMSLCLSVYLSTIHLSIIYFLSL